MRIFALAGQQAASNALTMIPDHSR
jgi:short chain dehydrogenase